MAYRLLRCSVRHYSTFLSRNSSSVLDDPPRLVYRDCPMNSQKNSSALKSPLPLPQTKAETNRKAERLISRAIAVYGQAGMFYQALNTFIFIHEKLNVTPSVKSLNGLLTAAIIIDNPHEVTRIYKDFPKIYSINPNVDTDNLVMDYFVDSGSTSYILSVFDDMCVNEEGDIHNGYARLYFLCMKRDVGIWSDCFHFLVDSLCHIGEFEHAFDDAMDMIREGLVPTLTTMKKLVNGLVRISKVDDAKELVKIIKDKFSENGDKWGELEEELPQES